MRSPAAAAQFFLRWVLMYSTGRVGYGGCHGTSVKTGLGSDKGCAAITVVSADEAVSVLVFELAIHVLLSLLHRNVHVSIEAGQHAFKKRVDQTRHGL
jgi:hypothetical protein